MTFVAKIHIIHDKKHHINAHGAIILNYKLDDLVTFITVARTGSFKSAAVLLMRDASVISRRISQLEKQLGVKLLIRTTRSLMLTEAGSLYYNRLRAALEEVETATREVGDFAATPQGTLRVSVPVTFGREMVAPLFSSILANYPKIKIDAHFEDRAVDVVGEGYDVVLRVGLLPSSTLISRKLGSFRSMLVASPEYVASHETLTSPAQLENHACLGFTKAPGWPSWTLEKDGEEVTIQPNCSLVADNSEAILVSAMQGTGIALTPDWMAASYINAGKLVHVLPGWRSIRDIEVHALMPPGALIPVKTRVFVDALRDKFSDGGFNIKS
ncbi:LysR family transcriptional regulator [Shigella flexneri]